MSTRHLVCTLALATIGSSTVQAQEPLTPLWQHVDTYGAGGLLGGPDVVATRLCYDQGTDRLYRAIIAPFWSSYRIQVFDTDGNDLTPTQAVVIPGIAAGDYEVTKIVRLSAQSDTLSVIVHGDYLFSDPDDLYWLKVLGTDGSPYYLVGTGSQAQSDFHHDSSGTWVLTDDELQRYGATGWPTGSIAVPDADGMAVLGNEVVLGAPPSIARIDRIAMSALAPIAVPSSGSTTTGICMANGESVFNYAALNSNGILDVGLADINSDVIWSTTVSLPPLAAPTAFHVDEQGDFWIAVAHNATEFATLGLLYRFHFTGGPYGVNSFSRRIDGIASASGRLFLTGRVPGSNTNTYLAAFDSDLITGASDHPQDQLLLYPDPAYEVLMIGNLSGSVQRLSILDAAGRIVRMIEGPFVQSAALDVSTLSPGSYLLHMSGTGTSTSRRFQVAR